MMFLLDRHTGKKLEAPCDASDEQRKERDEAR